MGLIFVAYNILHMIFFFLTYLLLVDEATVCLIEFLVADERLFADGNLATEFIRLIRNASLSSASS